MSKGGFLPRVKAIYGSIREALAYRYLDRDPGNRDITRGDWNAGCAAPRIDAALQLSTVWACVKLISETISTLPLITYERRTVNGREERVPAREFGLYGLLHDSPNADMTAVEFWQAVLCNYLLWGNVYCLKTRTGRRLVALDLLEPGKITVRRTLDGRRTYIYADPRGQREYSEDDVWHIKGFSTDGLTGLSPVGIGWRSVVGATAVENASADLFTNRMRPTAVLTVKEWLKTDQREQLKDKYMKGVFGDAQTGQLQLIEGATEFKQLSINPVDAQMLETRSWSVEDMCRWFNMPPAMIGHGTMVSNWGTGREQINLGFLQHVLRPIMVNIEQGIRKSLMTPAERIRYFSEYSVEGLLRADSKTRIAVYAQQAQNGLKTRNEIRALENDPALPGGDELTVQSNLIPISKLGEITATTQADTIAQDTQGNDDEFSDEIGRTQPQEANG